MKPNVFTWATKELSQDAFICWLASWSEKSLENTDSCLHAVANQFIQHCFNLHGLSIEASSISKIEVRKQYYNIDIIIIINDKYAIIIEDKLNTSEHSDQLNRYKRLLMEENYNILIPIYYKPFEQSDISIVVKSGYKHFKRRDMISILEDSVKSSDFAAMYYENLKQIDRALDSYLCLSCDQWKSDSWKGFFSRLSNEFGDAGWNWVNNPAGGFMGFWWHWYEGDDCSQYLQLEEQKLCFKIWVKNDDERSELRQVWHEKVMAASKSSKIKVRKPDRFGSGQYMTVAIFDDDYRAFIGSTIDYYSTLENIKYAMNILDKACV